MRVGLVLSVFTFLSGLAAAGAPVPVYRNSTWVQSPPGPAPVIDATTFINEGYFEVNNFAAIPLPFQSTHTLHFRNEASGVMLGHPGYLFEYVDGNIRLPMSTWLNRGSMGSFHSPTNFGATTAGNFLWVRADNITNSGTMQATDQGLIKLEGAMLNLTRGRMRTGTSPDFTFFSGGFSIGQTNNYFNDPGVTDLYWAVGTNNVVSGMGAQMPLTGGFPNFSPPYFSAPHQAIEQTPFGVFTNQGLVIGDFLQQNNFKTAAFRQNLGGETVVQVAFVRTNAFEPAINVDVRFVNDFQDIGRTIVVGFHSRDRDPALDRDLTNSVYLVDGLAFDTNAVLARPFSGNTRKPSTFEVTKGYFFSPNTYTNSAPNLAYDPTNSPLYRSTFTDAAVNVQYAAYAAQVSNLSPTGTDPTTFPGRIEILADILNMREARIRAESTLILRANDLVNNHLAQVSAPFINFDVGTTQPALVISNLAPPSISRLSGTVRAWSATWRNSEVDNTSNPPTTNNYRFHVLFVDNTLTTNQPVSLNQFHARGPSIVICDPLTVRQSIRLQGNSVHVKSNAAINFPQGADWSATTVVNVRNFTNDGRVVVSGSGFAGSDRAFGYDNFINRGTNEATLWSIVGGRFENPGCMTATAGRFNVTANNVILEGKPPIVSSNLVFNPITFEFEWQPALHYSAKIASRTDVGIQTGTMTISNAHLFAGTTNIPGVLTVDASTRLTDAGPGHTNQWWASGGIQVLRRPSQLRDLMGTYATVQAPAFSETRSIWPASDLGAVVNGFSNNLALGKLTIDGGDESIIRLAGLAHKTALYVDYLEFLNNATNTTGPNAGTIVEPTLKIYFAHSNLDASKLDAQTNGFRWVKSFTGPLSTTNITYPSGNVYPVNISVARDADLDSDGDGTVNRRDRTPIYVAESVALRIAPNPAQLNQVLLSWQAMANSTSYVEYKTPIASTGPWQVLRSTTAPGNMRITVPDNTLGRTQRIYRVRVDLPPQ